MTATLDSRFWLLSVWSWWPDPRRSARDVALKLERETSAFGPWRLRPRTLLPSVLFNERRYLHTFAWSLLEQQSYLQVELDPAVTKLTVERRRDDGSFRTLNGTIDLTEVGLHLFDDGVAVLALEITTQGVDRDDQLWLVNRLRRHGKEYRDQNDDVKIGWSGEPAPLFVPEHPADDPTAGTANALLLGVFAALDRHFPAGTLRRSGDPRMFVVSWTATDGTPDALWERLLWVDDVLTWGSYALGEPFGQQLTADATDARWMPGIRAGFTRYSAAWLCTRRDNFGTGTLKTQVGGIYYSLLLHHLVQQRMLLQLAEEAAEAAAHAAADVVPPGLTQRVEGLRKRALVFQGKHWFDQLSHQDQGVDYSRRIRAALGTETLLNDLRQELSDLESWLTTRRERDFERRVTITATALGLASFWVGALGANITDIAGEEWAVPAATGATILTVAAAATAWFTSRER